MDERIAVNAFEGGRNADSRLPTGVEQRRALHDEKGPQAFPAIQYAMPHRSHEPLRPGDFPGERPSVEKLAQHPLDRFGSLRKRLFECRSIVLRHGGER